MASSSLAKLNRVMLSIEEKLKILKKLDQGCTLSSIATEFGDGKSTVSDIKKVREKTKFSAKAQDGSSLTKRCIVTCDSFKKGKKAHQLVVF